MKKFISILLVCTLLLVGCGSADTDSNTNTSANVTDTNDSTDTDMDTNDDTSTTDTNDDTGDTQMIYNLPTQDQMDLKADKTDVSSPYKFKGSCTYANLPSSGNVINDTYYVTDQKCKYTWNGKNWYQSSLNESDYEDEFNEFKTEVNAEFNEFKTEVNAEVSDLNTDLGEKIKTNKDVILEAFNPTVKLNTEALLDLSSIVGSASTTVTSSGVVFELPEYIQLNDDCYYSFMLSINNCSVQSGINGYPVYALTENDTPITITKEDGTTNSYFLTNSRAKGLGNCRKIKLINYGVVKGTITHAMFYNATNGRYTSTSNYQAFSLSGYSADKMDGAYASINNITQNLAYNYLADNNLLDGFGGSATGTYTVFSMSNYKNLLLDHNTTYFVIIHLNINSYSGNNNYDFSLSVQDENNVSATFTRLDSVGRLSNLTKSATIYGTLKLNSNSDKCRINLIFSNMGSSANISYSVDNFAIFNNTDDTDTLLKRFNKNNFNYLIDNYYDTDIAFWGDSLTVGAGADSYYDRYPYNCASRLGADFLNLGVGGEKSCEIACRQGGNNVVLPAGSVNRTYAPNEIKDLFGNTIALLGQGSAGVNPISIDGYSAELSVQKDDDGNIISYSISGYSGEESQCPYLVKFAGSNIKAKINVIFVGTNDTYDLDHRIAIIDSMIANCDEHYLVLGLSVGDDSTKTEEDNILLNKYGNKFFPTRKLLSEYGMALNGLTPTSSDEEQMSRHEIPSSLKSDGVHLNKYGYTALGIMVAKKLQSLGYDELINN